MLLQSSAGAAWLSVQKDSFHFAGHLTYTFVLVSLEGLCMPFSNYCYVVFLYIQQKAVYHVQFHSYLSVNIHTCVMYLSCFSENLKLEHVFTVFFRPRHMAPFLFYIINGEWLGQSRS